jgi:hypothetical protein
MPSILRARKRRSHVPDRTVVISTGTTVNRPQLSDRQMIATASSSKRRHQMVDEASADDYVRRVSRNLLGDDT